MITVLTQNQHAAALDAMDIAAQIRRLRHESKQTELVERLQTLAAEHRDLLSKRDRLSSRIAEQETLVRDAECAAVKTAAAITQSQERLNAGVGMTSRDLLALQEEIEQARERLSRQEDGQLEAESVLERLQELRCETNSALQGIAQEGQRLQQERRAGAQSFAAQLEDLNESMTRRLNELDPVLARTITRREAAGQVGAALLRGGACGACGTALSGAALDTISHADPLSAFTCEECEAALLLGS